MSMAAYTFPSAYKTGRRSPFGLGAGLGGLFGSQGAFGRNPVITPPPQMHQAYRQPNPPSGSLLNSYRLAGLTPGGIQQTAPTAKNVDSYDINTDPAYQQAQALLGMSDEQATAAAQKQIKDALLAYGDPNLVTSVLGNGGADLAKAAANNPTSTVAQLGTQHSRNVKSLDDQLNSANLSYSGYRVDQEKQAAQDYQNALAQAAASVQGNIGQIQDALDQAIFQNQWQLAQAAQQAAQNGVGTGTDPGGSSVLDWARQLLAGNGTAVGGYSWPG